MTSPHTDEDAQLRRELEAVPRAERLDYLAGLPPERRARFKRILPREDIRKLNAHVDRLLRRRAAPSHERWLAEARAGRATSTDAMMEVLLERAEALRPKDSLWIGRIRETASGGSYSKRQQEVIRAIYARYFGSHAT